MKSVFVLAVCAIATAAITFGGCGSDDDSDGGSETAAAKPEQGFEGETDSVAQDTDTTGGTPLADYHKFHTVLQAAGYRYSCPSPPGNEYGKGKRTCAAEFSDTWPTPPFPQGPAGPGTFPFGSPPSKDKYQFHWNYQCLPDCKVLLTVRNDTQNQEFRGYSPSANSPYFFVTEGGVQGWTSGPITSGTDTSKVGQPGGPLKIDVEYAKAGLPPLKLLKAGYWINIDGYLKYKAK